jgi:hypothetical protein
MLMTPIILGWEDDPWGGGGQPLAGSGLESDLSLWVKPVAGGLLDDLHSGEKDVNQPD